MTGFFMTFEGIDGGGKTTQAALLAAELRRCGRSVVETREPGGSPLGDRVRELLAAGDADLSPETCALLFTAVRMEHLRRLILPSLHAGGVVVCDRYHDSTWVYQGVAGADPELLAALSVLAPAPDLTVLIDVEPDLAAKRLLQRGESPPPRDVLHRLREAFLRRAENEPERFVVLDGGLPMAVAHRRIVAAVFERLPPVVYPPPPVLAPQW